MVRSLLNRYEEEWAELKSKPSPAGVVRPTNPLLLNVPTAYFDADYKVMIFGQETNDWEGTFPHDGGVAHMLETYQKFYNDGGCYPYGGQFWNGFKEFKRRLQERCGSNGKSLHLLWNNLIKIGKEGEKGAPPPAILEWGKKWFDVVRFEVSELKPNIIVFFCGHAYDGYIKSIFPRASFEAANHRPTEHLARVTGSDLLPIGSSLRTYHPGYLYRQGRECFAEYMEEIIAAIHFETSTRAA